MRQRAWTLALGGALFLSIVLCLTFASESRASREAPRAAPAFEYHVWKWEKDFQSDRNVAWLDTELNKLGKDGWELITGQVGSGSNLLIFKRVK
jgi:hypothetical protein